MTLIVGSAAVVTSPPFVDAAGTTPTDADSTPTLTVTRADGTTITPSAVTSGTEDGTYLATIAAGDLDQPDRLTLTWDGLVATVAQRLTVQVEVAGGVYARPIDLAQMKDMGKYQVDQLDELRVEFEDIAERFTGRAWVPRFASEVHPPTTLRPLILNHQDPRLILSAVDATNTAVDTSTWGFDPLGRVTFANDPTWSGQIILTLQTTIRYTHGADHPPAQLVQACKDYVRSKALERFGGNRVGRDVLSQTDGSGFSTRYSTPDWDAGRPTGLLDVDRTLNGLRTPLGIA